MYTTFRHDRSHEWQAGPDIHVNKLPAPNFLHATDPLYVLLYTWIVQEFKKLNIL